MICVYPEYQLYTKVILDTSGMLKSYEAIDSCQLISYNRSWTLHLQIHTEVYILLCSVESCPEGPSLVVNVHPQKHCNSDPQVFDNEFTSDVPKCNLCLHNIF